MTESNVLYIGATCIGANFCKDVPAVSSRSLDAENFLDFVNIDETTGTRMIVNPLAQEIYKIDYVYGFSSELFSYFLVRQKDNTNSTAPVISKLIRICQDDPSYYSYMEVPIRCIDKDGNEFSHVDAAYLGKSSIELSHHLGIYFDDDVLYATFSRSEYTFESALCVYSIKSIHSMFSKKIEECFNGIGNTGLSFISPAPTCVKVVSR